MSGSKGSNEAVEAVVRVACIQVHPDVGDKDRNVAHGIANGPRVCSKAPKASRALIDRTMLTPGNRRGEVRAELYGAFWRGLATTFAERLRDGAEVMAHNSTASQQSHECMKHSPAS